MTLEAKFVRASYNREGYVILGYQASNYSIGDEWMLLEIGMTVLDNVPDYTIKREHISLETPDGKTIPLPRSSNSAAATCRRSRGAPRSSAIPSITSR